MNDRPTLLREHLLKELKLPTFLNGEGAPAAPVLICIISRKWL